MTPQTAQGLPAERQLFRHCRRFNCWAKGFTAWRNMLLPQGVVFFRSDDAGQLFVSLGVVGVCVLAWPLVEVLPKKKVRFYALAGAGDLGKDPHIEWVVLLDYDDVMVVPSSSPVSPLRQ